MELIAHRINSVEQLRMLPKEYGVELDLRDRDNDIIISHDPFITGERFEEYLKEYHHGKMIVNVKSERIEYRVMELLKKHEIRDYVFLDSSFPMIYGLSNAGVRQIMLRFSEFEGMETLRVMQGKVDWVWVDCFTQIPVNQEQFAEIKALGYKTCFVSPELQGRPEDIENYISQLKCLGIEFDAVCSKVAYMQLWRTM